ncbi:MAG: ATP synthase F1 subunit delta [Firmicutes bacterium]|nr:ATP synthase F1 subunit delta [Bacillota bacterium]
MTQTGAVYGGALYTLAKDEGVVDVIREEIDVLEQCFRSQPEYLRLLSTPNLSKEERVQVADDALGGKINKFHLSFLKILAEDGHAQYYPDCCETYRAMYNADHHILTVIVVSAVPLTSGQCDALRARLEELTGQSIALTNKVDARVIGGLRLDYDGKRLDATVASRLEQLRGALRAPGEG